MNAWNGEPSREDIESTDALVVPNLPRMNPIIEAAWIGGGRGFLGAVVGVTSAVIVARIGFHSARDTTSSAIAAASADIRIQIEAGSADIRAQIEADRRNRVWEKQAAAYTDAIAGILHRQKVRRGQVQAMITGTEPTRPPVPVNWPALEARLIAYSSPAIIDALREAAAAGQRFEDAVRLWVVYADQAQVPGAPPGPRPGDAREAADKAVAEANRLDDRLMDIIRAELHAGAQQAPAAPVPLAPPRHGGSHNAAFAGGQTDAGMAQPGRPIRTGIQVIM